MTGSIAFRRLVEEDLPTLFTWLVKPHVVRGYAAAPLSFAEVAAKFGPRTQADCPVRAYIVTCDGIESGYIQAYAVAGFADYAEQLQCGPGVVGMDLFLAEEALLGRGLGTRVIETFATQVAFADPSVEACIAGPAEGNTACIRAFERAGFRRWKRVRLDGAAPECVLRRERSMAAAPRLSPIDLARHAAECVAFRRDAYAMSFGSADGIDEEMGADNALYLAQLRARMGQLPEGNAHLWLGERIVGQAEMRLLDGVPRVGYVNLFYLVAEHRGQGLGRVLHDHAATVFRRHGMAAMRLSVTVRNERAIAFYRKLGWVRVGERPNRQPMEVLEYML